MQRFRNLARLAAVVLAAMLVLSACNTVRGVGRDVEKAGEVIKDSAD